MCDKATSHSEWRTKTTPCLTSSRRQRSERHELAATSVQPCRTARPCPIESGRDASREGLTHTPAHEPQHAPAARSIAFANLLTWFACSFLVLASIPSPTLARRRCASRAAVREAVVAVAVEAPLALVMAAACVAALVRARHNPFAKRRRRRRKRKRCCDCYDQKMIWSMMRRITTADRRRLLPPPATTKKRRKQQAMRRSLPVKQRPLTPMHHSLLPALPLATTVPLLPSARPVVQ